MLLPRSLKIGIRLALLCTAIVILNACNKDNDKKLYAQSVTVYAVEDAASLDLVGWPDLRADMATALSNTWSYSTPTLSNVEVYPQVLTFSTPILLSDEEWDFRLVDSDSSTDDDLICSARFNPLDSDISRDKLVKLTKNGVVMIEINLTEE